MREELRVEMPVVVEPSWGNTLRPRCWEARRAGESG